MEMPATEYKILALGTLPNTGTTIYTVPGSRGAIVTAIKVVNTSDNDTHTVQFWAIKRDGTFSRISGKAVSIAPKDVPVDPILRGEAITLATGEGIQGA